MADTNEAGFISREVAHYQRLAENVTSNRDFVIRMYAPMVYLSKLEISTKVDRYVEKICANSPRSVIIASLDPHRGRYLLDVMCETDGNVTNAYFQQGDWKYACVECSVPDGPVSGLRLSLMPGSWPITSILPKLKEASGVYIPDPGEDLTSVFVTVQDGGKTYRCGALWGVNMADMPLVGRIGTIAIIPHALAEIREPHN